MIYVDVISFKIPPKKWKFWSKNKKKVKICFSVFWQKKRNLEKKFPFIFRFIDFKGHFHVRFQNGKKRTEVRFILRIDILPPILYQTKKCVLVWKQKY